MQNAKFHHISILVFLLSTSYLILFIIIFFRNLREQLHFNLSLKKRKEIHREQWAWLRLQITAWHIYYSYAKVSLSHSDLRVACRMRRRRRSISPLLWTHDDLCLSLLGRKLISQTSHLRCRRRRRSVWCAPCVSRVIIIVIVFIRDKLYVCGALKSLQMRGKLFTTARREKRIESWQTHAGPRAARANNNINKTKAPRPQPVTMTFVCVCVREWMSERASECGSALSRWSQAHNMPQRELRYCFGVEWVPGGGYIPPRLMHELHAKSREMKLAYWINENKCNYFVKLQQSKEEM